MIREAMVFHYMDDLDSKIAAVRAAMATESGDDQWSAYSPALGRKFLRTRRIPQTTRAPTRRAVNEITCAQFAHRAPTSHPYRINQRRRFCFALATISANDPDLSF